MSNGPDAQTFHIVLVEDNAADIYLFRQAMEGTGLNFELTVIEDGAEALAFAMRDGNYAESPVPDLVVLDLNLPKIGGCEVLEALRQNRELSNLSVAVLTSSTALRDNEKCKQLGVARYITKAPDLEEFLRLGEIVKQILLERTGARHTRA